MKICETCKKEFQRKTESPSVHARRRFCSPKCCNQDKEIIARRSATRKANNYPRSEQWLAAVIGNKWSVGRMSPWARNNPQTFKKGMTPWNKGLKKGDHPGVRHGESINTWKGGVTPEHEKVRKSDAYSTWRKHVLQRDDYTCQACGKRGGNLHVDHELPFALFPELRFEILNGRTLCISCHQKTPTYGARSSNPFNIDHLQQSSV